MADQTRGAGVNAVGATSNSRVTEQRYWHMTDSRPQALLPGSAASRLTTSCCSMKYISWI